MKERCDQCGTPTIPMDPSGRREPNCDCVPLEDMPLCGYCGGRIDLNEERGVRTMVYGLIHAACDEDYQDDIRLGLDSED